MPIKRGLIVATALALTAALAACGGPGATTPAPTTAAATTSTAAPTATTAAPATPLATPAATPSPVASGTLTIDGVRIDQLATAGPNLDLVYAATASGLYRRSGTQPWTQLSSQPVTGRLLVDPTHPDTLYQGDHAPCARGGASVAFQKSTDGGKTWQTLAGGQDVRPQAVDPVNPSRLYGDKCQLAVSVDGGQTWTTSPVESNFDVSSMALSGSTLEVVYVSEGGTTRLVPVDVSNPSQPTGGAPLLEVWGGGAVAATGSRLVVGEPYGVHVSADGGKTWSFSRAGLEKVTVSVNALSTPIPQDEISQGFGVFAVAVDPGAPGTIFAGTIRGLYRSADGGKTWAPVSGVSSVRVRALAFAAGGAQLYVTTDDGVTLLTNP